MAKEVLLYGTIYSSYDSKEFVNALEEAKDQDIVVRVNTDGGDVEEGFAMVCKFADHKKKKSAKVDAKANSMGLFFLCYCAYVECYDISGFLLHRAAYSSYVENNPDHMTQAMWDSLKKINDKLRAALEAKIDVARFKKITGYTLDDVFNTPGRLDVELSAQDALAIGLVNKINQLTPEAAADINGRVDKIAAHAPTSLRVTAAVPPTTSKTTDMTIEQLKKEHPALYASIFDEGVKAERDRVGAWMAFQKADPERVAKAIKEGNALSQTDMAELGVKMFSANALDKLKEEAAGDITTSAAGQKAKTEAEKTAAAFEAEVDAALGIKK